MKRSVFFLLVSFFIINGAFSQSVQVSPVDSICFEKLSFDYGKIEQNSSGECEFSFMVKGNKPVVLTNVLASCGCTSPEWPKNPLKPGETGKIKVKYNTASIGRFHKTITVYSSAANSTVGLSITGEVIPKQHAQ